jgi:5'(3')-deoxyribonucleotidase
MHTKCYLDMDGLLANLFDFISNKIINKNYIDATDSEKLKIKSVWVDKDLFYQKLGTPKSLFANLEPYSTNDTLIKKVVEKFGGFYICSHPSKMSVDQCIEGKLEWIDKHIIPKYFQYFRGAIFPDKKSTHALNNDGSKNLLIDDFQPYVDSWSEAGGIAIKLQSALYDNNSISLYIDKEFEKNNLT